MSYIAIIKLSQYTHTTSLITFLFLIIDNQLISRILLQIFEIQHQMFALIL